MLQRGVHLIHYTRLLEQTSERNVVSTLLLKIWRICFEDKSNITLTDYIFLLVVGTNIAYFLQ